MEELTMQQRSKTAVLFIHGFMGSPKQFQYMEPTARGLGADVYALTLPGHCASLGEFVRSGRTQWAEHVRAEIDRLKQAYARLFLVGHSMGCLFAAQAALDDPAGIGGILAIALPLYMRVSAKGMRVNLQYMMGRMRKPDARMQAAREFCGVDGIFFWNAARMLPRVLDVLHLCKKARAQIERLDVPLTIVHSNDDEWVSRRTLAFARKRLGRATVLQLEKSGHFWYVDTDRLAIREALSNMLKENSL